MTARYTRQSRYNRCIHRGHQLNPIYMRNYTVHSFHADYSISVTYIAANSSDEARLLVYNDIVDCIETLKADLVVSSPILNGDMANEFNNTHY